MTGFWRMWEPAAAPKRFLYSLRVLLIAIIAWLVIVGLVTVWVGLRAWRTFQKARAAQKLVSEHEVFAKIELANERSAALKPKQEALNEALSRLQHTLDQARFVQEAAMRAVGPALVLRSFLRRR